MNEPWQFKLARVHWEVGQTLLPMHFTTQEEALQAEMRLHTALSGLPSYGIASLKWDEKQIPEGFLAISSLTAVTRSGFVINVPGNAHLERFALEDTGRPEATVYLHVLKDTLTEESDAKRIALYAQDPRGLRRVIHRLRLSIDPELDDSMDSLMLARVARGDDKQWRLVEGWAPPLLLVGANPLLEWLLDDLRSFLERVEKQLSTNFINDVLLHQHHRNNASRALMEVHRLLAMLDDMGGHVYPHPYHLFDALRRLFFEACAYVGEVPRKMPAYRHDAPGEGLAKWYTLLDKAFKPEATQATHQRFKYEDGRFVLSPLPEEVRTAGDLYLIVHRYEEGRRIPVEGLKLASPSRLPVVRRVALRGVPFEHVENVGFPHALDAEIDWYRLRFKGNEEWQHALKEDALAFYAIPGIDKDARVSLFWRR